MVVVPQPDVARFRLWPRPISFSGLKIGTRLGASFVAIIVLLLITNIVAFWELRAVRAQAASLTVADRKLIVVLQLHTAILAFRERIDQLANTRDLGRFTRESTQLRDELLSEVNQAEEVLTIEFPGLIQDSTVLPSLESVKSSIPSQVAVLNRLAAANDWSAVRLRADSQITALIQLTSNIVDKVDSEMTGQQARVLERMQRGERQVLLTLSGSALVTILVAAILGIMVTRSITLPLAELGESAKALAVGGFVPVVSGARSDELSELSRVFQRTSQQLHELYIDLRNSEARFRTVIETAQVGIAVFDAEGKLRFCNSRLLVIFGMSAEQILNKPYGELANTPAFYENGKPCPREEYPVGRAFTQLLPTSGVVLHCYRPAKRDWIWMIADAAPVMDHSGALSQVVATVTDITHQKEAEEALRRSEAEFRIVFDTAAIGMTLVDTSGRLIRVNPAFLKLLQYSPEELENTNYAQITHPDDVAVSTLLFQELMDGKREGFRLKKRYLRKDGTICWAWLTTSAMRLPGGPFQYCVSMIEDITKQEEANEALRQLSLRMLRIQEEEQRRIAREVHDSTSQEMTALALNLGALKKTENLSAKAGKLIANCLKLAQQVSREIRTFSYLLHPPMLDEFGLWSALRVFVTEFRNRSGIRAGIEIDPQLEYQRLAASQEIALFRFVQEAFTNIYRHSGSKTASIEIRDGGESILITVVDQGRGIPKRILKEFAPFTGKIGSVGILGMRERIMQIGGRLEIQSSKEGTTIRAEIPKKFTVTEG